MATEQAAAPAAEGSVRTCVLSGLGGVGKTQLAVDHAERLWTAGQVDLLVWVDSGSREAIVSGYARLAADLTGVEDRDPEHGAQRLLEWLAGTSARWLVVLDDVQRPGDTRGLWPTATPTGQVLMTTRRRDAALRGHRRRLVEVGVFTEAESRAYVQAALAGPTHLLDGADGLVSELGHLPLALAQACAYILDRDLSCAQYQVRWADRHRRLASLLPEAEALPDEHRATVATTWSLSIEQADRLEPVGLAGHLLDVASMLDPHGIPADVLVASPVTGLLTVEAGHAVSAEQARDALRCLQRLSMITLDPHSTHRAVRVHALVQRATRDNLSDERAPRVARVAAGALVRVWPTIERDTALSQVLRANTEALNEFGGEHLWEQGAYTVLFYAGQSLGTAGSIAEARDYFQRLHGAAASSLGPDHPAALNARNSLATYRAATGDLAGASAAYEVLLSDQLRVLGPDHPHTLATRGNIAYWRGEAGDPVGAVTVYEALLDDQSRVLGPDHPGTLAVRNNLARARGMALDLPGATTEAEALLGDLRRVLGPDHPNTLTTRSNLARWRGIGGDPAGAAVMSRALLSDQLRVLGPDHPDTLTTRGNLARWQGMAGDPAGAVAACEELLTDRRRVLGPDHPDTLMSRGNLALWRGLSGDRAGAIAACEALLKDQLRVLGPDHPEIRTTRSMLAQWHP
ncbi:MAG: tetratricopeptide repeat protein [Actinoallomurus sp.]